MSHVGHKAAIDLQGCDGSQDIILTGLTDDQLDLLRKLAAATGSGGCTPGLNLAESAEEAHEEMIEWNALEREEWMDDADWEDAQDWDDRIVIQL